MNFGLYYPPFHLEREKPLTAGPRWMEWINGFDLMLNNCYVAEVIVNEWTLDRLVKEGSGKQ